MDIPESAFSALRQSPPQFARELRLAAVLKWYEAGMTTEDEADKWFGIVPKEGQWENAFQRDRRARIVTMSESAGE